MLTHTKAVRWYMFLNLMLFTYNSGYIISRDLCMYGTFVVDVFTGRSALDCKEATLRLLLGAGCQLNTLDDRGFTPLDRHVTSTLPSVSRAVVVELVTAGALLRHDLEAQHGRNALMYR